MEPTDLDKIQNLSLRNSQVFKRNIIVSSNTNSGTNEFSQFPHGSALNFGKSVYQREEQLTTRNHQESLYSPKAQKKDSDDETASPSGILSSRTRGVKKFEKLQFDINNSSRQNDINISNGKYPMNKTHYLKSYRNLQKMSKTPRDGNKNIASLGINQVLEPLVQNSVGSLFESVKTASQTSQYQTINKLKASQGLVQPLNMKQLQQQNQLLKSPIFTDRSMVQNSKTIAKDSRVLNSIDFGYQNQDGLAKNVNRKSLAPPSIGHVEDLRSEAFNLVKKSSKNTYQNIKDIRNVQTFKRMHKSSIESSSETHRQSLKSPVSLSNSAFNIRSMKEQEKRTYKQISKNIRKHRLHKDLDIEHKYDSVDIQNNQQSDQQDFTRNFQSVDINTSQINNITLHEFTGGFGGFKNEIMTQANTKSISGYSNLPKTLDGHETYDRSQIFSQGQNRNRDQTLFQKSLKQLQQNLDLKELDLKCKKDEIISKETQALSLKTTEKQVQLERKAVYQMKLKSIIFQQDIYLEELAELQNLLCKKDENKNVIALISRIAVGLKDSASQFTKMIDKLYAEMIQVKFKTQMEMVHITKKFSDFKMKNNLDDYFKKYLSDDTRKNTLKLVDSLMIEDDWLDQMKGYKEYLEKLQYSEAEQKLQMFYDDLIQAENGRFKIIAEQNEMAEETLSDNEKKPPLPVALFNQELEKTMDDKYNFGVRETGKKVVDRLLKQYVKPMSDSSTQTMSLNELTLKYEKKIDELERAMDLMADEYQMSQDITKTMTQKAKESKKAQRKSQEELNDLYEILSKTKSDLTEKTAYIEKLNNEMVNIRKDRDINKQKAQEAIKTDMASALQLKMQKTQLELKNKMVTNIREDAKSNAINNIKLNKKVTMQEKFLQMLKAKTDKLIEKIKNLDATALDDEDNQELDFEVKSEDCNVSELDDKYNAPPEEDDILKESEKGDDEKEKPVIIKPDIILPKDNKKGSYAKSIVDSAPLPKIRSKEAYVPPKNSLKQPKIDTPQEPTTPIVQKSTPGSLSPSKRNDLVSQISTLEPKNEIRQIPELAEESLESIGGDNTPNQDLQQLQSSIVVNKRESTVSKKKNSEKNLSILVIKDDHADKLNKILELGASQTTSKTIEQRGDLDEGCSTLPITNVDQMANNSPLKSPLMKPSLQKIVQSPKQPSALSASPQNIDIQPLRKPMSSQSSQKVKTIIKLPPPKITMDIDVQTDQRGYINFACDQFLKEMKLAIKDESKQFKDEIFYDLLNKAQDIITRIKSKAVSSNGISGGVSGYNEQKAVGSSVQSFNPISPSNKQPVQKSWHFDTTNSKSDMNSQGFKSPRVKVSPLKFFNNFHQLKSPKASRPIKVDPADGVQTLENSMIIEQESSNLLNEDRFQDIMDHIKDDDQFPQHQLLKQPQTNPMEVISFSTNTGTLSPGTKNSEASKILMKNQKDGLTSLANKVKDKIDEQMDFKVKNEDGRMSLNEVSRNLHGTNDTINSSVPSLGARNANTAGMKQRYKK